ncbi:MAG: 4'-phosphopantetheinyl transferase superfamily protein [Oscillospiraceae bacterium]|nr:4'-phosphopantetheinyl transferase superfamily protein [Oscillospiraceae bacterium]
MDIGSDSRKNQHETGIMLLQKIIYDKFGYEINEKDIAHQKLGKPYLPSHEEVRFSISHCRGLCCCIAGESKYGIDCENIRDFRPNVVKRVFTASEAKWFDSVEEQEKPRYFFIIWTLKEAFGKYTGMGIADMKNVSFSLENGILTSDKADLDFFVYEHDGYILSICVNKGEEPDCTFGNRIY